MAIGSAIQRGNLVYVYNERGRTLVTIQSDNLLGFTPSTVVVRRGNFVYTHDETGRTVAIQSQPMPHSKA